MRRLTEQEGARIRKIRDTEGLGWSVIARRFGVSPSAVKCAYDRDVAPPIPRRWHTAATRLGISAEEYSRRRKANQAHCGRCDQWFDRESKQNSAARCACRPCLRRDDAAERKAALTDEQRADRIAAGKRRRAERAAAQNRRNEDRLIELIKANAQTLGPVFRAVDAAKLTEYSDVTITARLRRLEARGLSEHTPQGWRLTGYA